MRLFDIIPGNFFSILVSKNREIYVDALTLLNEMFKLNLNIRVDDYITSLISALEDREFMPEEDDETEEGGSLTPTGKARLILNRFIKTGWVDKEFLDGSFVEIITPRNYAIHAMKFLEDICDTDIQEYNSLVFSTYSGLKQARTDNQSQMYEAILSAKANTDKLGYELRTLYHGIRGFLRDIQEQNDINILLKNHFEEYKKMSDRIYHPIKTMDSVYRYMAPIQNVLADVLGDSDLLHEMCERAMTVKRYEDEQTAEREITSNIDYVMETYRSIGGIINQIDRKHRLYTKSSIEKIQYLMTADQTIKGKLVELLKTYASADSEARDVLDKLMEKNININRQEFIDGKSLYHKNVKSRRIYTEPLKLESYDDFSEDAMSNMIKQIKDGYPISRVHRYVNDLFAEWSSEIQSRDISLKDDSDFILLLLTVVRANDRGMNYIIEMNWIAVKRHRRKELKRSALFHIII